MTLRINVYLIMQNHDNEWVLPLCQVCAKCQKCFYLILISTLNDRHHYSYFIKKIQKLREVRWFAPDQIANKQQCHDTNQRFPFTKTCGSNLKRARNSWRCKVLSVAIIKKIYSHNNYLSLRSEPYPNGCTCFLMFC